MKSFLKRSCADLLFTVRLAAFLVLIASLATSCSNSSDQFTPTSTGGARLVRSDFAAGEVTSLSQSYTETARAALDAIAAVPAAQRTPDNTLLALESTMADLDDNMLPLAFMGYVSTDEGISSEGSQAEEALDQFKVTTFSRRDLYEAIVDTEPRNADEARLLQETVKEFEHNGLELPDDLLAQVRELRSELVSKETQYMENLNNDETTILLAADEVDGLPADYLADLPRDGDGNYIVGVRENDYLMVMPNAASASARQKMLLGRLNRCGVENSQLLADAVSLRAQIAHLLGFQSWGDYRTDGRMAEDSATVLNFLDDLQQKLAGQYQSDMAQLLAFKQQNVPDATSLEQWDLSYYANQLRKRDYHLDTEEIRQYFPTDVVLAGMFQVFEKMLGIRIEEVEADPNMGRRCQALCHP